MPRRRIAAQRNILPDPRFGSLLVARLINQLMLNGKKTVAQRVVYGAIDKALERTQFHPPKGEGEEGSGESGAIATPGIADPKDRRRAVAFVDAVLKNIRPSVEVRSRRVGGSTYQVPVEVRATRAITLGFRWLIEAARSRSEHAMFEKLAAEMAAALENKGGAVRKREDVHRMANASKAFAHYSW